MQVEGVDLPIAANVIDEFDKSVDPEDTSNDQDGDKGAIFLNPGREREGEVWWSLKGRCAAILKNFARLSLNLHLGFKLLPHTTC